MSALLDTVAVAVVGTAVVMLMRLALPVIVAIFSEPPLWGSPLKVVMYRVAAAEGVVLPLTQLSHAEVTVVVYAAILKPDYVSVYVILMRPPAPGP